jgi:hypothetical protein
MENTPSEVLHWQFRTLAELHKKCQHIYSLVLYSLVISLVNQGTYIIFSVLEVYSSIVNDEYFMVSYGATPFWLDGLCNMMSHDEGMANIAQSECLESCMYMCWISERRRNTWQEPTSTNPLQRPSHKCISIIFGESWVWSSRWAWESKLDVGNTLKYFMKVRSLCGRPILRCLRGNFIGLWCLMMRLLKRCITTWSTWSRKWEHMGPRDGIIEFGG